jgi:amino acid adenylation domain-containing protein
LGRVREVALGAYAHQDLPFEKLVEELQPERNLAANPLFQVLFAVQNAPTASLELARVKVTSLPSDSKTVRFDLEVYLSETSAGLTCTFVYATDLFDEETIVRMMTHYQRLLEEVVGDPNRSISQLGMLTQPERHQIVEEWNRTAAAYPREKTIHGLFEEQVERAPQAVALVCGKDRVTFRDLNRRSNQLARYLLRRGVGPEVLVGLCLDRSVETVVGLLAVLKAGGAYVPLDPSYPRQRLAFMLKDAAAPVILTQQRHLRNLPEGSYERVRLDADWPQIERESEENPKSGATPRNLAYVIYTSGSTGVPKGVAIEHGSAVALLSWARSLFSGEELSGVLASTSVSFDLSVFEIFAPLAWGGKVILAKDVLELPDLPARSEVKLINTVPSAMKELLRTQGLPASVVTVNLAGEPLSASLVGEIFGLGTVRQVFDLYGPTEDTTYSTCAARSADGPVNIGRPISNKRSYILDRRLQPVPIGVPGELYLAGAGVARGYLNRPELTAERFLADSFSAGAGGRLYRTGDLARYRPDGSIEFLGRLDRQIKVRGFRVEPGEVEAALEAIVGVQEAIVRAREDVPGETRLVGYVVPDPNSTGPLSVRELRRLLSQSLPAHLVPSTFVLLDKVPRTPTGKLDSAALPPPESTRPELDHAYQGPRTPVEETLTEIWMRVLRLGRVGIYDNFFEVGGHSLLATQVISRARDAFHVEVPLRDLFEHPTVAALALAVTRRQAEAVAPLELDRLLGELETSATDTPAGASRSTRERRSSPDA